MMMRMRPIHAFCARHPIDLRHPAFLIRQNNHRKSTTETKTSFYYMNSDFSIQYDRGIHCRHFSSSLDSKDDGEDAPSRNEEGLEPMARLYTEWSLEDDRLLFANRKKAVPELAAMLGRGLRGIESRIEKLTDVDSPAYQRLFAAKTNDSDDENDDHMDGGNDKLIPAREVLRRIQWDHELSESDFSVMYYDRIDDDLMESPMDAPNTSVSGKETKFVLAIPEHRIECIKYKEQVVWDKERRIDKVFGSMGGKGQTIRDVIANYDDWKFEKDATEELSRRRRDQVLSNIQSILGQERYQILEQLSSSLFDTGQEESASMKREVERYVQSVLQIFQDARRDPITHHEPSLIPASDYCALDTFSEWIAVTPESSIRSTILLELNTQMYQLAGKVVADRNTKMYTLPNLNEDDLTETFVRGSGAGGQKVNKTSNCVVLVHGPTQLRVDCQDTRSLQQNRKIARKRLQLKLDEFLNGSQSKTSLKNTKAATKKAKAKARSKTRLKKKKEGESTDESIVNDNL